MNGAQDEGGAVALSPVALTRTTRETDVAVRLGGDGSEASTPIPIFTHFLEAMLRTWGQPAAVRATGDVAVDPHHLAEDVGIVLGQALGRFLPGYTGIARYGWSIVPMDDALAEVALDLSGRAGCHVTSEPEGPVGGVDGEVFLEFFEGFCRGGTLTLHIAFRAGSNRHHRWEGAFKALGLALRAATAPREGGVLSTKGMIG